MAGLFCFAALPANQSFFVPEEGGVVGFASEELEVAALSVFFSSVFRLDGEDFSLSFFI